VIARGDRPFVPAARPTRFWQRRRFRWGAAIASIAALVAAAVYLESRRHQA
jgi:hypothetical protein